MRRALNEEEVEDIKKDMYIDLFFDVLILMIISYYGKLGSCGIPVYMWNFVYFVILGIRTLSNLVKIHVIRNFRNHVTTYSLLSFVIIDGFFLGWLIYGNILFYSEENDCDQKEET